MKDPDDGGLREAKKAMKPMRIVKQVAAAGGVSRRGIGGEGAGRQGEERIMRTEPTINRVLRPNLSIKPTKIASKLKKIGYTDVNGLTEAWLLSKPANSEDARGVVKDGVMPDNLVEHGQQTWRRGWVLHSGTAAGIPGVP